VIEENGLGRVYLGAGIVYGTVLVIIVLVVALRFLFIDSVG
jgi:hypothetical protein